MAEIALPGWMTEMLDEECLTAEAEEEHQRYELDQLLHTWHTDGSLSERLEEVIDWVERVETVLVYVQRRVFSRSDSGSSTLIRDGVLPALRDRAPADWSPEERLFVAAIQLLFRTGRAVRFEDSTAASSAPSACGGCDHPVRGVPAGTRRAGHRAGEHRDPDRAGRVRG